MRYLQTNKHSLPMPINFDTWIMFTCTMIIAGHIRFTGSSSRTVGDKLVVGDVYSLHLIVREHANKKLIHMATRDHVTSCF